MTKTTSEVRNGFYLLCGMLACGWAAFSIWMLLDWFYEAHHGVAAGVTVGLLVLYASVLFERGFHLTTQVRQGILNMRGKATESST